MKLNIGAGKTSLEGYEPWDLAQGRPAFPLDLPDNSVESIYASHILEHFGHRLTVAVLKEWFRVLKPGGDLRVAVPDFEQIVRRFLQCEQGPWEAYILGGQVDDNDQHRAIFNRQKLEQALTVAGFEDIRTWKSTIPDCASLDISLNLAGTKPLPKQAPVPTEIPLGPIPAQPPSSKQAFLEPKTGSKKNECPAKVVAVWSVPRLGFMDTFKSIYLALPPFGIPMVMGAGVFWGQALECAMESAIEQHDAQWFLSLDYDSVFGPADLAELFRILGAHPGEIDALCPFQWCRTRNKPLFCPIPREDGTVPPVTDQELLANDIFPLATAHFGLTMIRAEAVKRMPHPWFLPTPNEAGRWGEGKVDDDIYFWRKLRDHGGKIFMAPRVVIGHAELDLRWPGRDLNLLHQHMYEFNDHGRPRGVFGDTTSQQPTTEGVTQ